LPRLNPPGIAQHIIQRGNNRQICFSHDEDFSDYLKWLAEYSAKFGMDIHAYVLMTNHTHILATPRAEDSIPKTMQSLGRQYVRHFNQRYQRSGTLWEGRYKSCLVQDERYLLECYRYIELNPVRARIVNDPADYCWSSYGDNGLGQSRFPLSPHDEYLGLGRSGEKRRKIYRSLFTEHVTGSMAKDIRDAVNKGMALGSDRFKDELETNLKRRVRPARMGRPSNPSAHRKLKSLL
jgi:putative transposase